MAASGLLLQGGPVRVGGIPVHLKAFRLRASGRVATVVGTGVSGRLTGCRFGATGSGLTGSMLAAGAPVPCWLSSSSMTSVGLSAAVTATAVISSSSGSTPKWDLYPSKVRARDLRPRRASTSTVKISRSQATRRAMRKIASSPCSTSSWPATSPTARQPRPASRRAGCQSLSRIPCKSEVIYYEVCSSTMEFGQRSV